VFKPVWLRFRRYVFEHAPELAVFVLLGVLLAIVLAPRMIYTIPAGHVGVLWKRLDGGTVLNRTLGEGIKVICPGIDRLYDVRMQLLDQDLTCWPKTALK